jgi:hypothetical protein
MKTGSLKLLATLVLLGTVTGCMTAQHRSLAQTAPRNSIFVSNRTKHTLELYYNGAPRSLLRPEETVALTSCAKREHESVDVRLVLRKRVLAGCLASESVVADQTWHLAVGLESKPHFITAERWQF